MLLSMLLLAKQRTSQLRYECTKSPHTKVLISSNAKYDEELSGCCSEVRHKGLSSHHLPFSMSFPADKSMSILLGRPICFRDEDCTVNFPKELDDE
jgi:hypothetical protein